MNIRRFCVIAVCSLFISYCFGFSGGYNMDDSPFNIIPIENDTIPLKEQFNDFITDDNYNPFDIQTREITQEVEYDPETGNYFILEKIGDEYFRSPTYMTFEEYLEYSSKKAEKDYFAKLGGISTGQKSDSGKEDPMSKIELDKALLDRMFGGNKITIEPQGNIDLTFGVDYSYTENQTLTRNQQRQGPFPDFDMDIQMNVEGKIGEKLSLDFNYDTQASFDFDRKIKIDYNTELFSEDDIVKKIEAGNVSLPLRSNLIQGAQSLFGLKAEVQFGKLRVTGLLSQQRSNQESLTIEGGSLKQEFEIRPTEYDENRHFFLSHYHRDQYETTLKDIPNINSAMNIVNVEVWVSNFRNDNASTSRQIAAIADLGEPDPTKLHNPSTQYQPFGQMMIDPLRKHGDIILPDNDVSELYSLLQVDENTRLINNVPSGLRGKYGMTDTRDFETFRGRKLSPNEFSYHPQLGFISLNIRLRTDQVLAVSYEYNYTYCDDQLFKVGEPTDVGGASSVEENMGQEEEIDPEKVIYTKLLKSSNQRVSLPSWDLMMKNVYPLGSSQLNREDFKFDIFYEDNTNGSLKRFIPEAAYANIPLLNVFNLDRLNATLDPQPDGIFDYVEGVTINNRTGSIYFPVLEPFGSSLCELLDPALCEFYQFQEIYDATLVVAEQTLEKNLFVMKGEYKSSVASEISLGSWNLPQGSVRVTAGSTQLVEGQDFEVDYGIGRLRIINPSYLQAGTPIRVSFEDNSLFSLQQKNMIGLRGDYAFSENLNLGATYLKLKERPFTQKVNLGDDPINNRVFGLDLTYGKEVDWVTKVVDKLPFYSTKDQSNINFTAEIAGLKPGHSGAINLEGADQPKGGVVSIDDFEGSGNPIPIGTQNNAWVLASTPNYGIDGRDLFDDGMPEFIEGYLSDSLAVGYNRALLNWNVVDNSFRSAADNQDPYTRRVDQVEFFDRDIPFQLTDLFTFDLNFFPDERGPYNFDVEASDYSAGVDVAATAAANFDTIKLNNPESRWGGIMRYLPNNDFQAANIEYLDFWVLNPYMDRRDGSPHDSNEAGKLIFHLGNISEDILKDDLQFFENAIPTSQENLPTETTVWGEIPIRVPILDGFNVAVASEQDFGFDGLEDANERAHFQDYLMAMEGILPDIAVVQSDPSNDNFEFIGRSNDPQSNLILRTKKFNNPEGNYPDNSNVIVGSNQIRGNPNPDKEDLNGNSSLNQGESFYEYVVDIKNDGKELDTVDLAYYRDKKEINDEIWYRFQIPVGSGTPINGIEGFRSIQFMRMVMTGFSSQKTFRFAEMELVRNTWRRQETENCIGIGVDGGPADVEFALDDVGLQENAGKLPFNYVLPPFIKQEQLFNSFSTVLQDEKALSLNICNLPPISRSPDTLEVTSCEASVFKATRLDMRVFEEMEMFVHAEQGESNLQDGDLAIYIKFGKDFKNNYYEYELPITFSDLDAVNPHDPDNVWRPENKFKFPFEQFTELKKLRNSNQIASSERFTENVVGTDDHKVTIKGLPSLGFIKGVEIGIRNYSELDEPFCGEIWINELRVTGLQERGGFAGQTRLEVQMADLGAITSSAGFTSIGWGALDQKVDERAKESVLNYDVATDLNLGKFLPENWNLRIPFYAQYAKEVVTPEFDAYELDLTLDEVQSYAAVDGIDAKERSQEIETIKTFNFTNVRKERGSGGKKGGKAKKPRPWNIENLSASYSQTETDRSDFLIKEDKTKDQRLQLEYSFSSKSKAIKPFKKVKGKWLRIIKEINFNLLPSNYYVNSEIRRFSNTREFREPDQPRFVFDDKRFTWDRNYGLKWDLFKNLKFNFDASNRAVIDELRQTGIADTPEERNWVDVRGNRFSNIDQDVADNYWKNNFRNLGRNKNYNHKFDFNYTAPLKYFPLTDWITVKARYNADYSWAASSLDYYGEDDLYLGDVIQNGQQRSLNATFGFDKLYRKSKFLKNVEKQRRRKKKKDSKAESKLGQKPPAPRTVGKKKKKEDGPSGVTKALIRPLLILRSVKFNYKEDLGTIIPGISRNNDPNDLAPEFLGLSNGFEAPGWAFVSGWQPDLTLPEDGITENSNNWVHTAQRKGWFTSSKNFNAQLSQEKTQNYEAKVALEPFKDFKLDVDFKKQFTKSLFENFKNTNVTGGEDFQQLARREVGSFEVTYSTLNTFFNNDFTGLFDQFKANRALVSNILNEDGLAHTQDGNVYYNGYGAVQTNVIIPSFIAAYTGKEISADWIKRDDGAEISSGLLYDVSRSTYIPKPNWTLRYNGLKNLPWFEDRIAQFSLSHSYKSTLRVNQFITNQDFNPDEIDIINPGTGNYYSRFEMPLVQISENFSPLIGIQLKTKNEMNFNLDYKKGRSLDLSTDALGNLQEKRTTGITIGMGWTKKNVNIGFLTRDRKGNKKKKKDEDADDSDDGKKRNTGLGRGAVSNNRPRDLTFNVDFSFTDDQTFTHNYTQGIVAENANRGQKSYRFNPSVDYNVSENLTLRLFFDYESTAPYVGNTTLFTRYFSGLTARFNLN